MKDKVLMGLLAVLAVGCVAPKTEQGADGKAEQRVADTVATASGDNSSWQPAYEQTNENKFEGGEVCRSSDGKVAIRAGMYPGGGTSPEYWAVWTIEYAAGKKREIIFDPSAYVSRIYTISKRDGSTYYLLDCSYKASAAEGENFLMAYRMVGDTIRRVNVVDGGPLTDDDESRFSIIYCIPNWYFATDGAGYDWLFHYDTASRKLYVPLTEDGDITDRYEVWQFDGNRFVSLGRQPHMNLHPGVGNYRNLVRYLETTGYRVRVDRMPDGSLRYASWARQKTMADTPDVVLLGGKRRVHQVAPDKISPCDDYYFKQGNYEYIVDYCEPVKQADGSTTHTHYLMVRRNGRVVLKQARLYDD